MTTGDDKIDGLPECTTGYAQVIGGPQPPALRWEDQPTGLVPKPPNPQGVTMCHVRWIVETGEWWLGAWSVEAFDAYASAKVAAERERCAKLCEAEHVGSSLTADDLVPCDEAYNMALQHAAAAIRAA